jgi:O-antigen ligase/Tfp pilus assembly protein PilF
VKIKYNQQGSLISLGKNKLSLSEYNQSIWIDVIEILIIVLITLVSIAFYPHCIPVFSPIKETIAEVLVVIGLMFWGIKLLEEEKFKFVHSPLNIPVLILISVSFLSLIWSDAVYVSLQQLPLFLIGPLLYFIIINNIHRKQQINRILTVLLILGGVFGIYGILQYNGIDFSIWAENVGRFQVFGLFGNVNYFAEYLIVPLPIAVSLFLVSQNKFKRILLLIGILAMGTTLMLTFTRSSYLGFGISIIFMFSLFLLSQGRNFIKNNRKIFIIVLAAIIIMTFIFTVPTPLNKDGTFISKIKSRLSFAALSQSKPIKRRIATWKFTALMIKDHFLIGSGIGTFKYNTLKYQAKFFEQGDNRSIYPYGFAEKSHNEYLQLWAELGIIGLLIFIWLLICYFNYGIKLLRRIKSDYRQGLIIGLMGSIVAVLVDALFGFPLHLMATIILFWLVLGLTITIGRIKPSPINENLNQKNFSRFKPLLYLGIIFLAVFLCVTITRPFIARVYYYYGNKEIEKGNVKENIKNYEKALKYDPYLGEVYYSMGLTLANEGFYNLSQEYFEKAEKFIDHPNLPKNLAFIYLSKGQLDKAAIKLEQAISYQEDKKSMLPLYLELGKTYIRINKYELAEMALKNALKIDPDSINAHYGLGNLYLQQDRLQEALKEFQEIVKIAPDTMEAEYSEKIIKEITEKLDEKTEE